jgi:hypothetical protein
MAVHSITVKKLISRVRQVFPGVQESYMMNLINDSLVELGMYNNKIVSAKLTATADQMWYDLSDGSVDSSSNKLELNKVSSVYIMDNDGDYIKIPRLLNKDSLMTDVTSELNLEVPD